MKKRRWKNPHAVALGRLGGSVRSAAKRRANRANGRKGGLVKSRKKTLAARRRSDAGCTTRDLAEFILLDTTAHIVRISLVGLPGIAQIRRLHRRSGCGDVDVRKRQLLGLLRKGSGRRGYDRHRGNRAGQSRSTTHERFATCSQIVSQTIMAHLE